MISRLCANFGNLLPSTSGNPLYTFPSPNALTAPDVESRLRELGFGYRAPFVARTARMLCEISHNSDEVAMTFLASLRNRSYDEAREALLTFPGVGPKVADCIALFGLGFHMVVPVDTHIWAVATRDYGFRVKGKARAEGPVSKDVYGKVKEALVAVWGDYAGWAQQVLCSSHMLYLARSCRFWRMADPLHSRSQIICQL